MLKQEFMDTYKEALGKPPRTYPVISRDDCHGCLHIPSGRCSLHQKAYVCDLMEYYFLTSELAGCGYPVRWNVKQ